MQCNTIHLNSRRHSDMLLDRPLWTAVSGCLTCLRMIGAVGQLDQHPFVADKHDWLHLAMEQGRSSDRLHCQGGKDLGSLNKATRSTFDCIVLHHLALQTMLQQQYGHSTKRKRQQLEASLVFSISKRGVTTLRIAGHCREGSLHLGCKFWAFTEE